MTSLLLVICSQTGHATSQRENSTLTVSKQVQKLVRNICLAKGWYLDPELQLTYGHLRAAKYLTDTGVTAQDQKLQ